MREPFVVLWWDDHYPTTCPTVHAARSKVPMSDSSGSKGGSATNEGIQQYYVNKIEELQVCYRPMDKEGFLDVLYLEVYKDIAEEVRHGDSINTFHIILLLFYDLQYSNLSY